MRILVQYKGQLRTALKCGEEEIELPDGGTVASLLSKLSERHSHVATQHLLTTNGRTPTGLLTVVNDAAISSLQCSMVVLNTGDVVTLLPPIAGG